MGLSIKNCTIPKKSFHCGEVVYYIEDLKMCPVTIMTSSQINERHGEYVCVEESRNIVGVIHEKDLVRTVEEGKEWIRNKMRAEMKRYISEESLEAALDEAMKVIDWSGFKLVQSKEEAFYENKIAPLLEEVKEWLSSDKVTDLTTKIEDAWNNWFGKSDE